MHFVNTQTCPEKRLLNYLPCLWGRYDDTCISNDILQLSKICKGVVGNANMHFFSSGSNYSHWVRSVPPSVSLVVGFAGEGGWKK